MASLMMLLAVCGAPVPDKTLDGTWVTEKIEIEGAATNLEATIILDGEKYTVMIGNTKDVGSVSIDTSKKPAEMNVVGTEGVNKGKTYLCIYELKDGKLTICYSLDEKVRPTKFETAKDSKTMLAVYKKK